MKNRVTIRGIREMFVLGFCLVALTTTAQQNGGGEGPGSGGNQKRISYHVVMEPDSVRLQLGDTFQFRAYLQDSTGARKDTTFRWSLSRGEMGSVSETGVFTALKQGTVHVIASAGPMAGKAMVRVMADSAVGRQGYRVMVNPRDTLLLKGQTAQYTAYLTDTSGAVIDTTFEWSLSDPAVGSLDADAVFAAAEKGHTRVIASVGNLSGWGNATVIDDPNQWRKQREGLKIKIDPPSVVLAFGDTLRFTAVCTDSQGSVIDTAFSWSVNGFFGSISETGLFEALQAGQGFVIASTGQLSDMARVIVRRKPDEHQRGVGRRNPYKLEIDPADTTLLIGATLQFEAFLEDTSGNRSVESVTWTLLGKQVGTLSQTGLLTAESRGLALIQARFERYTAVARVMVLTEQDLVNRDPVQIRLHDRDGSQVGNIKRMEESDVLKISGLPFPLNILNGGELILPPGSLDEGITIEISLPSLAEIRGDTAVSFTEAILNGFSFDVYVNGVKVSPYVFETPVQVVLPYKPDLMEKLGITPDDLAVFFYNEDGSFEDAGIFNVVVDTTENKVYAEVAHFSQVILGDRSVLTTTSVSSGSELRPVQCMLFANFPNPFNPETEIRFDVAASANPHVKLTIFNLLGRQIRVLADAPFQPGRHELRWDGRDDLGSGVASGVYLYRLESGTVRMTRRMLLLQ